MLGPASGSNGSIFHMGALCVRACARTPPGPSHKHTTTQREARELHCGVCGCGTWHLQWTTTVHTLYRTLPYSNLTLFQYSIHTLLLP